MIESTPQSTFLIKRDVYPDFFMAFNEFGYCDWTSHAPNAQRVLSEELVATMERIEAVATANGVRLSAHLIPNK